MPVSKLNPTSERKLKGLEKKYDARTKHVRDYYSDLNDINELLKDGVIDRDHADMFVSAAKSKFQSEQSSRKVLEHIKTHPHETPIPVNYEGIGKAVGFIIGLMIFLFWALPSIWL